MNEFTLAAFDSAFAIPPLSPFRIPLRFSSFCLFALIPGGRALMVIQPFGISAVVLAIIEW
ncbi:MAG TPA: hypothetical protein VH251_08395 [Verrucomicrobiae bacterium]|nr:hypothetical protein [Verrucomicrobiae bacterium]